MEKRLGSRSQLRAEYVRGRGVRSVLLGPTLKLRFNTRPTETANGDPLLAWHSNQGKTVIKY